MTNTAKRQAVASPSATMTVLAACLFATWLLIPGPWLLTFMLRHQDFVPQMISAPALFTPATYEDLDEALLAANQWIKENEIQVVSVETVVLPNIWHRWEEGTKDPALGTSGESPSHWHQFIRVWYRAGEP